MHMQVVHSSSRQSSPTENVLLSTVHRLLTSPSTLSVTTQYDKLTLADKNMILTWLSYLFNLSLSTDIFTLRLKEAKSDPTVFVNDCSQKEVLHVWVLGIFKRGNISNVDDYRPISMFNSFFKVV